jgi:hypothetical protein
MGPGTQATLEGWRPLVNGFENDQAPLATDDNLRLVIRETAGPGQSNGLTTAVLKELCTGCHPFSIYYSIYAASALLGLSNALVL